VYGRVVEVIGAATVTLVVGAGSTVVLLDVGSGVSLTEAEGFKSAGELAEAGPGSLEVPLDVGVSTGLSVGAAPAPTKSLLEVGSSPVSLVAEGGKASSESLVGLARWTVVVIVVVLVSQSQVVEAPRIEVKAFLEIDALMTTGVGSDETSMVPVTERMPGDEVSESESEGPAGANEAEMSPCGEGPVDTKFEGVVSI